MRGSPAQICGNARGVWRIGSDAVTFEVSGYFCHWSPNRQWSTDFQRHPSFLGDPSTDRAPGSPQTTLSFQSISSASSTSSTNPTPHLSHHSPRPSPNHTPTADDHSRRNHTSLEHYHPVLQNREPSHHRTLPDRTIRPDRRSFNHGRRMDKGMFTDLERVVSVCERGSDG